MKMFKKFRKYILLVIISFAGIVIISPLVLMVSNPMHRPEPMIRDYVLRLTPKGMSMEDAIAVIENNDACGPPSISYNSGFAHPMHNAPGWPVSPLTGVSIVEIGDKSIRVVDGPFRPSSIPIMGLILQTRVSIFWGFDEDGKLIEVYVWADHGVFS